MKQIESYQIIYHGVENSQYFQGCGVSFTKYDTVYTGCADNAKEAYHDAIDQIASDFIDCTSLPERPHGIRKQDKVPVGYIDDFYCFVSIRIEFKD